MWFFDLSSSKWSLLNSDGVLFPGIYGHSAIHDRVTGFVYVVGGLLAPAAHLNKEMFIYDIHHQRWDVVRTQTTTVGPASPVRYFHSAVPYEKGR